MIANDTRMILASAEELLIKQAKGGLSQLERQTLDAKLLAKREKEDREKQQEANRMRESADRAREETERERQRANVERSPTVEKKNAPMDLGSESLPDADRKKVRNEELILGSVKSRDRGVSRENEPDFRRLTPRFFDEDLRVDSGGKVFQFPPRVRSRWGRENSEQAQSETEQAAGRAGALAQVAQNSLKLSEGAVTLSLANMPTIDRSVEQGKKNSSGQVDITASRESVAGAVGEALSFVQDVQRKLSAVSESVLASGGNGIFVDENAQRVARAMEPTMREAATVEKQLVDLLTQDAIAPSGIKVGQRRVA